MRNYGRFTTTMWRDPDFTDLTATQQAVYFMLATQPEVSAAGTLPLTLRRWAKLSAGMTPEQLRDELKHLEASPGRHVIVDEDTEELLIRKFVKFDGGIVNEKRRPVIEAAAAGIQSPQIRQALAVEMRRLGRADMASVLWTDAPPDTSPDAPPDTPYDHPENAPSDTAPDTESRFDRVGLSNAVRDRNPSSQPTTREGAQPASPIPADAEAPAPPAMFCTKHPNGTEDDCGPCGTARKRYAGHVQAKIESEAAAKAEALQARRACGLCDDRGMRLHPESKLPMGRCDHQPHDDEQAAS